VASSYVSRSHGTRYPVGVATGGAACLSNSPRKGVICLLARLAPRPARRRRSRTGGPEIATDYALECSVTCSRPLVAGGVVPALSGLSPAIAANDRERAAMQPSCVVFGVPSGGEQEPFCSILAIAAAPR
jgi:hypothetical protein